MDFKNKKFYKDNNSQLLNKLNDLKKIIEIIDSNNEYYEKGFHIFEVCKNSEEFKSKYKLINEFGQDDLEFSQYIVRFEEIYNTLLKYENEGLINNINYVKNINHYLNNYEYAKKIIDAYISSDMSFNMYAFLEQTEINDTTFKSCLNTIKIIDPKLYQRYEEKAFGENYKLKYKANINALKNIECGIRTGGVLDGTEFDILEFWKRIPFKYSKGKKTDFLEFKKLNPYIYFHSNDFYKQIENFTRATMSSEESKTILKYMKDNNIKDYRYISADELRKKYSGTTTIINWDTKERKKFSSEDFENVIYYMKNNKYPFLIKVFTIAQQKYINGEINVEELKAEEKVKIAVKK